jgi:hypothetical protein
VQMGNDLVTPRASSGSPRPSSPGTGTSPAGRFSSEPHRRSPPMHPSFPARGGQASPGAEPAALSWRPAGQERGPLGASSPAVCGAVHLVRRAGGLRGNGPGQGRERPGRARRSRPCPGRRAPLPRRGASPRRRSGPLHRGSEFDGEGNRPLPPIDGGRWSARLSRRRGGSLRPSRECAELAPRMRAACLRSASAVQGLAAHAIEASRPVLADALRQLTASGAPSGIAEPAAQALDLLGTRSSTQLFLSGGMLSSLRRLSPGFPRRASPSRRGPLRAASRCSSSCGHGSPV